ncbi:hypothetical protein TNIN_166691 [Trichonephila inaurata madagascariensis]|uniref:Ionotropic glutamate receptor L-glutamate and glycine-binding domain-containing protein n=1 Tax=Trichonephila inaurata madagascariensis TaxID=2747483 RepID=A0A8X6WPV6_9ARAC|nr:hypothetical protein TNIN_166691 [Trichonephila inaurata madagascariensis]
MRKKTEPGVPLEGNESFEGYCKDLADLIAEYLKFSYVLKLVNDSNYGGLDSNSPVGWNGMVGELIGKILWNSKQLLDIQVTVQKGCHQMMDMGDYFSGVRRSTGFILHEIQTIIIA